MSKDYDESPPSKANAHLRSTGRMNCKRSANVETDDVKLLMPFDVELPDDFLENPGTYTIKEDDTTLLRPVDVELPDDVFENSRTHTIKENSAKRLKDVDDWNREPDVKKLRGDKSFSFNVGGSDASSVNLGDTLESHNSAIMLPNEYKEVKYASTDSNDSTSDSSYFNEILDEWGGIQQTVTQCPTNANESKNESSTRRDEPTKYNNTSGKLADHIWKDSFDQTHFNNINQTNDNYEEQNSIAEHQAHTLATSALLNDTSTQVNSQLNTQPTGSQTGRKRGRPPRIKLDESKRRPNESDKKFRNRIYNQRHKEKQKEKLSSERNRIKVAIEKMQMFVTANDQPNYSYLLSKLLEHKSKQPRNRKKTAPSTNASPTNASPTDAPPTNAPPTNALPTAPTNTTKDRKERIKESRRKSSAKSRSIDAEEQELFK